MADFETVSAGDFEVVGLEVRAANDNLEPIGALWGRFSTDELMAKVEPADDFIVALYCEYEGDHTEPYTYFLGRRIQPGTAVPEGLARRRVPAGTFAKFVAEGEQPAALIDMWQSIWGVPLERRYLVDYELHQPGGSRVEIFVGC